MYVPGGCTPTHLIEYLIEEPENQKREISKNSIGLNPLDTCILVHLLLGCYKIIHLTTEYQVLNNGTRYKI